jgi:hypothetical protein
MARRPGDWSLPRPEPDGNRRQRQNVMGDKGDAGVVECVRFEQGRIPGTPGSFVHWEVTLWQSRHPVTAAGIPGCTS